VEGSSDADPIGRQLAIPLRFVIHPSLAATAVRFLQLSVPLRDGRRYAPESVNLRDAGLTRDTSLYRTLPSGRGAAGALGAGGSGGAGGASGLVRNSSEGALLAGALSPQALAALSRGSLAAAGARPRAEQQRQMWLEVEEQTRLGSVTSAGGGSRAPSLSSVSSPLASADGPGPTPGAAPGSPLKRAGVLAPAAQAAPLPPADCLGVTTDVVVELGVRNRSERYFRTWLSRLPGRPGAEGAESAVVVLEPGDHARLLAPLLPAPPAAGGPAAAAAALARHGSSSSGAAALQQQQSVAGGPLPPAGGAAGAPQAVPAREPPARVATGERLVEALGVRWEMITGDVAPDRLPRGLVRLAPVDAAHALTPGAPRVRARARLGGVPPRSGQVECERFWSNFQ
jgi:hypothetical protein